MKIGLITERKHPPDRRVVLTPDDCTQLLHTYPDLKIEVETSPNRVFTNDQYRQKGIPVTPDISGCDLFLGVKEVPVEALIPNKKYMFFSHTIKKQPYNRHLLRAILQKNIELYDHETLTDAQGMRLVAFGYYAGLVGAYNGLRAFGIKHKLFDLPKAENLHDATALKAELSKISWPALKVLVTGKGRVGSGVREILQVAGFTAVSASDFRAQTFEKPVFAHIDVLKYNRRKDGNKGTKEDFYRNPQDYQADFLHYTPHTDLYIAAHFYGDGAPAFFQIEDLRRPDFKISVIADISCDIGVPIPTTLRASTIADPIYGVDRETGLETDFSSPNAIAVMAVDNLPCELPRDASKGFSKQFTERILPAFFNRDQEGILQRARVTQHGKLTSRFDYLKDYVNGV